MTFGWTNYSNACTNVTPELKVAMSAWTLEQFHFFRSTITKAWWKSFFKDQRVILAFVLVGICGGIFIPSQGGADKALVAACLFGVSFLISLFSFVRALLSDRADLLKKYRRVSRNKH